MQLNFFLFSSFGYFKNFNWSAIFLKMDIKSLRSIYSFGANQHIFCAHWQYLRSHHMYQFSIVFLKDLTNGNTNWEQQKQLRTKGQTTINWWCWNCYWEIAPHHHHRHRRHQDQRGWLVCLVHPGISWHILAYPGISSSFIALQWQYNLILTGQKVGRDNCPQYIFFSISPAIFDYRYFIYLVSCSFWTIWLCENEFPYVVKVFVLSPICQFSINLTIEFKGQQMRKNCNQVHFYYGINKLVKSVDPKWRAKILFNSVWINKMQA